MENHLLFYSIEVAIKSKLFSKVIVSTDDEEIKKIARSYNRCSILRPKELKDDFTGTGAVVNHAIEFLKAQGEK